ncbi:MAG: zf-HC2 domain-containing protein [Acidimicrobiia bacterium]
MISCATARERAPELALGILDGAERAELLHHLVDCANCQAVVAEHNEIADLLPQLAPQVDAPPGFDRRVLRAFRGEHRRITRRTLTAVAAAIAAATITSIVVVRVIDADDERSVAAPELRTVSMIGAGGTPVGRLTVSAGTPAALAVSVDYAVPDGGYTLRLRIAGSDTGENLGTITIVDGRGQWNGRVSIPASGHPTVALVTPAGATVCEAQLSD